MKRINKILGVIAVLGILVGCLFGSIEYHGFNKNYYEMKYTELDTAKHIGMSNEALFDATFTLLDYLKDERDDILCVQEVKGKVREIYDERETLHMVDVKNLYINVKNVCFTVVGIGIAALLSMFYFVKTNKISLEEVLVSLKDGFRQVVLAFIIVISGLLFYALVDFNRFWTMFHQIFFDNDLWLLDPRVSIMINMFPEDFWFGMVIRIALTFIVSFTGISFILYKVVNKELEKRG